MARDDKKNPLISTFDWTNDAVQRVFRVPAGFMRNKTQERIEALAGERGVSSIDLALVEDGIEIGKQMMAEMIANYPTAGKGAAAPAQRAASRERTRLRKPKPGNIAEAQSKAQVVPAVSSGYLNEVSALNVPSKPGDNREH